MNVLSFVGFYKWKFKIMLQKLNFKKLGNRAGIKQISKHKQKNLCDLCELREVWEVEKWLNTLWPLSMIKPEEVDWGTQGAMLYTYTLLCLCWALSRKPGKCVWIDNDGCFDPSIYHSNVVWTSSFSRAPTCPSQAELEPDICIYTVQHILLSPHLLHHSIID